MNKEELKRLLDAGVSALEDLVVKNMPQKGDKEEDCQRLCIINRLNELSCAINGIESEDLVA